MENVFNQWLLVSDIDGTLNSKSGKLPLQNKTAIFDYVAKGGNFTLCSGRNLQSLSIHYKKLNIETPAIFLNGAGIYDFSKKEIVYFKPISTEGENIILELLSKYKTLQLTIFAPEKIYRVKRTCIYGYVITKLDGLSNELCKTVKDVPRGIWGKATFFGTPKLLKKICALIKSTEYNSVFDCFFTSPFTLEIVSAGVNKGHGVKHLASLLNISEENTAAIGDYYNDESMFRFVKHPVCCGQAPEDLKALCEKSVCHCNDGAVAQFIEYITDTYIV